MHLRTVASARVLIGRREGLVPKISKNAKAPSRIINDTKGVRPQPVLEANICFATVKKRMLVCVTKATDLSDIYVSHTKVAMRGKERKNRPKLNDGPQGQNRMAFRAKRHSGYIHGGVGSAEGHFAEDEKNKSSRHLLASIIKSINCKRDQPNENDRCCYRVLFTSND